MVCHSFYLFYFLGSNVALGFYQSVNAFKFCVFALVFGSNVIQFHQGFLICKLLFVTLLESMGQCLTIQIVGSVHYMKHMINMEFPNNKEN